MSSKYLLVLCSLAASGCVHTLALDPGFAAQAVELPMVVPGGFFPPAQFTMGTYAATDVSVDRHGGAEVDGHSSNVDIHANFTGSSALHARITGPGGRSATLDCKDHDNLACALSGSPGTSAGTIAVLTDQAGNATAPDGAFIAFRNQAGDELRVVRIHAKKQVVQVDNSSGIYALAEGRIVGALDTTYPGAPHAWMARGLSDDQAFDVATALLSTFLVINLPHGD